MKVERFKIQTPEQALTDLHDRLKNTRWPDTEDGWEFGTDLSYMKELVDHWLYRYDWRSEERDLNRLAQFKVTIDDIPIHFVHEKGKGPDPVPLILTHGWPDSFLRFRKIIPMLTDPGAYGGDPADSFDVVVPSIPGFGFSGMPGKAGNIFHVHDLWARLMAALGYSRYAAHGGDWGAIVTEHLARSYGDQLVGIHLTDVPFTHTFQKPKDASPAEERFLAANQHWQMTQGAYNMIQSTRPQTLAIGLNDSPVGLAAWLIEKFQAWNDCDATDWEKCFGRDELITNVMIYWMTGTVSSSFLPYYDMLQAGAFTWIGEKFKEWAGSKEVPAAFALFPMDNSDPPREWAERFFHIERWTKMEKGAHFAAMEQPGLLAKDIRSFFHSLRAGAHGEWQDQYSASS